ncbi:MAG: UDP-N-acetylmuramoyl-tripeptide--D-alanyl-D-alanine ligase [Candidatus Omnitrophica bacterium]|nr:UDP-N-acetylmuramoyl-tripeptide--D-alanyl-D-alanine ligase [Candidatus Omnitrophota bacterium]
MNACSEKAVFFPEEACRELNVRCLVADPSQRIAQASLDTRTLKPGSLFTAFKGAVQDGHDYLAEAFRCGAAAALVSRDYCDRNAALFQAPDCSFRNLIPVADTEQALVKLAQWRRQLFHQPVIGVTGSVGKTSTKEMLGYLLSKRFLGLTGSGNFNNQLGLPLNLIALDPKHDFCLTELGASKPGDIRFLTQILRPTHALITQVSPSHLEGFGSLEAIYNTKLELAVALADDGLCIIPDFDPVLIEKTKSLKRQWLRVGETAQADYRVTQIRMDGRFVEFMLAGRKKFRVPAAAAFFSQNAAMAAAMADQLGYKLEDQPSVWDDFCLPAGRFERRELGDGVTVIYDGYNASPASFKRSIEGFKNLSVSGRKAVVFADMLELGPEEDRYHRELAQSLVTAGFDFLGGYGRLTLGALGLIQNQAGACEVKSFETPEDAGCFLAGYLRKGDAVLLKASRGMRIDKTLKMIEEGLSQKSSPGCR